VKTTTGTENTGIGKDVLKDNTSGAGNVAIGVEALTNNKTTTEKGAVGKITKFTKTTGAG